MASTRFFIGIDISKAALDITVLKDSTILLHQKITNSIEAIGDWLKTSSTTYGIKRSNTIFCMEGMGLYGSYLLKQLGKAKAKIWVESPLQIKRSLGLQRGKNDKVDSMRIAQYCYINRHKFKQFEKPRSVIEQLQLLNSLRSRIITSHVQLSTALNESKSYLKKNTTKTIQSFCKDSILSLKQDKKATEDAMLILIKSDERLDRLLTIMTSVPFVGKITAIHFLIVTNEFKKFDSPKKFACYCGVAPFEHSSGTTIKGKTRISRLANIKMKTSLHLCAILSVRWKGELQDFYKRKVAEGKSKMSVLNAIRNKIIHRVFACVKEDRLYQKERTVF